MSSHPINNPTRHPHHTTQEQAALLAIVRAWHPSPMPEYRGFRCSFCQSPINAAWHHWLHTNEYRLPVHLCNERCEARFLAGTLPISSAPADPAAQQPLGNANLYSDETTRRFRAIARSWAAGQATALHPFVCDACGDELPLEGGPDGSRQRQGYHVWWQMEPEH